MASFLTEWRPFAAPSLLNRSSLWDDMVRDFFGPSAEAPRADLVRFSPRASVHETAESYVVRVDLPGVKPEDVTVTVTGDTLTIAGKKIDREAEEALRSGHHPVTGRRLELDLPKAFETGGIVGEAVITGCVGQSDDEWFVGKRGILMRDARPLPFVPCKGALGFFTPDLSALVEGAPT